jgi:hydroxymethylpyrimidine/phosphomethylpyrimidine kinase
MSSGKKSDAEGRADAAAGTSPTTSEAQVRRRIALTIAGFDPSSGAGVTADLKVFAAHGLFGMACISALTVQSTQGVRRMEAVDPLTVRETLDCLDADVQFAGVKIGMLASAEIVAEVQGFLTAVEQPLASVVLDPVLRSSSGRALLESAGVRWIREELLAQVGWVTPNLEELGILTGLEVRTREEVPDAARSLQLLAAELGNRELNVVVTGGHLERPDDFILLATGQEAWLPGERVNTTSTHGTGCAFSSALTSRLILGDVGIDAAVNAKSYVSGALLAAYPVGGGRGPINHFFAMDSSRDISV